MKLTRLLLARYGHLSDVEFAFDPDVPMHIVLGANEAGKSTALSAIGDALFGFPHRSDFGFLHKQAELRLGIGVRAADGREQFFLRRKGRIDTLRDADDAILPESAMAAFLAGASREKFTQIFGMDGAELRRGGADILDGKGEIGQSIVQAHTGLHNTRGALNRLNEAALELYGDKRGGRAFHIATEAFRTARQDVETRSIRPAEYDQAAQERADIVRARAGNASESERLERERARLDRIRRTTPARLALLRDREALAALGDVASLPADAEQQRSKAVQALTLLGLEFARAQTAQAADEAALAARRVDAAVLAEGGTIDALAADLNRIEGAVRDRETQRLEAAQARRRVQEDGQKLGLDLAAEDLAARLPGALLCREAERALREHTSLAARRQEFAAGWEQAEAAAVAARAQFAALEEPAPLAGLVAAVDAARSEGRIDDDLAQAEEGCAAVDAALARALAAVPFWKGGAEALAQAPVPLASAIAQHEAALAAAQAEKADRAREAARLDQALQAIEADLAGVLAAGAPPTAAAIAHARDRRDRAWRLIRILHIERGSAPPEDGGADLPADLPGALGGLITEADTLADRRTEEAERVASYEQLRASQSRLRVLRAAEASALEKALEARADSHMAWQSLWCPAGVTPGEPATMREFLARRQAVLGLVDEAAAKQRSLAQVRRRRDVVRRDLAAVLAVVPDPAQARVAPLLQAASRLRTDRERAHQLYAEAKRSLTDKEAALAALARKGQALETAFVEWHAAWAPVAQSLGLPPGAGAEAGAEALAVWADIDRHARDLRVSRQRIEDMTADIDFFTAQAAGLCARCAPDLDAAAPGTALRTLAARLAQNRAAESDRAKLRQEIGKRAAHLATLAADIAKAQDELAALRSLAGVDSDEALRDAIARADRAAGLVRNMAERASELHRLDDGLTLEALAREAGAEDHDLLPGRIAGIDERRRAIAAENEGFASRLRDLDTRIAAMERGQDAADAAQRMRNAAAEAEEIAARYVRLRLSHSLLRAGIERFRREQQAPLLAAAGTYFAALTGGRYASLAIEESEEARMVVAALRPDGFSCPADRLSEGARDQLYLALRLAAISFHAEQTEPLPFIADDLLASFDDTRARATLRVLARFGKVTQTILFTHHAHIAGMAESATTRVHTLPA